MVTSQITLALAHFYQQKLLMNFHGDAVPHMYTFLIDMFHMQDKRS